MEKTATWRVSYGNLFALVEAGRPETAVEIARAWRARKHPAEAAAGEYTARLESEKDIAWAARFGSRPYTKMPPKPKREPRAQERVEAPAAPDTPESDETAARGVTGACIAILCKRWRVADDALQWIVQRREGQGWRSCRFPTRRTTLLRDVRELCGTVSPEAVAVLEALPDRPPGFAANHATNMRQYWRENPDALKRYIERHARKPAELETEDDRAAA